MERQQWNLLGAAGLGAAGLGAGLMYLLDPTVGGRRRALARHKAVRAFHVSSDALRKSSRDLGNRGKGLVAGARSRLRREEVPDEVLERRVRSQLGHVVSHPGAVEVEADDGCVLLLGDVLAAEHAALLAAVRAVPGVCEMIDRLDVHASSDGVSALQNGDARQRRTLPPAARLLAGTAGGAVAVGLCLLAAGGLRRGRDGGSLET